MQTGYPRVRFNIWNTPDKARLGVPRNGPRQDLPAWDQNELANHFMKGELGALLKAARDLDKDVLIFVHEQSGSPFDPQVVDLFFRVFES